MGAIVMDCARHGDWLSRWHAFAASIVLEAPCRFTFSVYVDAHVAELRATLWSPDRDTGVPRELTTSTGLRCSEEQWLGRHQIVLDLVNDMLAHELREHLLFDGVRVLDPHL